MGSQTYMTAFVIYFIGLFIVVSLISLGGGFASGEVRVSLGYDPVIKGSVNDTAVTPGQSFKWSSFFKDVFSFFVFNVSSTGETFITQYLWLVRLIFVYIPLTLLVITFYYSLPTVSG